MAIGTVGPTSRVVSPASPVTKAIQAEHAAPVPPVDQFEAASQSVLRKGAKGQAVSTLQELLTAKGFDPGPADGKFGAKTAAAVRKYQKAAGLHVDGVVGPKTWAALAGSQGTSNGTTQTNQTSNGTNQSSQVTEQPLVNTASLPGTYTYNGVVFDTIAAGAFGAFGSIKDFAATIQAKEITNKGDYQGNEQEHPMQCHNYSQAYGGLIMGDKGVYANLDDPNLDDKLTKREYNTTPYVETRPRNQQEAMNRIVEQLERGIPVVVRFYPNNHYGLAVGIAKNHSNPLQLKDVLYLDSYDGQLRTLGDKKKDGTLRRQFYPRSLWIYEPTK